MEKSNILEVRGISKSFKGRKIIDNLNLTVKRGDVFGFLGPNGSGKTTTIRMILRLIHTDGGTITINGYDVKNDFSRAIEKVGAIVEVPKFYGYLSGRKNLELTANLWGEDAKGRIDEVLELVGLSKRADDKFKTYSLGMKQRLGIANALVNNPSLVILDEPTNGLDPQGMKEIRDLVISLAREKNITFFISTHLLHEVELMCSRVAILSGGKIIAEGRVDELIEKDYETIEVCTSFIEEAEDLIKGFEYSKSYEKIARGFMVKLEKGKSGQLNQILTAKNIKVDYLIPHSHSLEDFFLETINGGDKND